MPITTDFRQLQKDSYDALFDRVRALEAEVAELRASRERLRSIAARLDVVRRHDHAGDFRTMFPIIVHMLEDLEPGDLDALEEAA